jgi:hypothetical protein
MKAETGEPLSMNIDGKGLQDLVSMRLFFGEAQCVQGSTSRPRTNCRFYYL